MKKIAILGSTGSIGTQALDIIDNNPEGYSISVLSGATNMDLLSEQVIRYGPAAVAVPDALRAETMRKRHPGTEILVGMDGLIAAASETESDLILNALVGMIGLLPTYAAIKAGKDIALANKETLVAGGSLIMEAARENGVRILPVDSEHSAIFQCLAGNNASEARRLIITASGGPFRGKSLEELETVTLEQALKHPKWKMGSKITIDSATLMNKGLEVIEAHWLFDMPADKIDVVVHPQSIIHSMVEFRDHSVIAQLGVADMRIPIGYAFSYPERESNGSCSLDLLAAGPLTFERPDMGTFRCLQLAYDALVSGGSYPVVLNAANEELVRLFLDRKIRFLDIQNHIERIMQEHVPVYKLTLETIMEIDKEIRERVGSIWL